MPTIRRSVITIAAPLAVLAATLVPASFAQAADETTSTPAKVEAQTSSTAPTADEALAITSYDGVIYAVDADRKPSAITFEQWRDVFGFRTPDPAPTDWVWYSWSPTMYAVTFWTDDPSTWMWHQLTYPEWRQAKSPLARPVGWIAGSSIYQWSTSDELFLQGPDNGIHKLRYDEWQATGPKPFETRYGGFKKLTWSGEIGAVNDNAPGGLSRIDFPQWQGYGYPNPALSQRFPGDIFYQYYGEKTIWYAGPLVNRTVTFDEWRAAGSPAPEMRGTPPGSSNDQGVVTSGAFCSPAGATGRTSSGTPVVCKTSSTDSRLRWRAA